MNEARLPKGGRAFSFEFLRRWEIALAPAGQKVT